MKSKYSDTYFAFHYAVKHQDYTKWFSPVILAVDTWSIHVWQTEATRARCYLRREREGVKTQHNWHNSLACQRSPVYSAALSAVLTFLLAAFQPTTPVFPSTLALNMEDAYTILCDIRARNKVFRRACSQVILLNHQIEASKARYDSTRAVKRLSFRYSNRLKLTSLEGVRNLVYDIACVKCDISSQCWNIYNTFTSIFPYKNYVIYYHNAKTQC